jgi:hypothetical protein
MPWQFRTCHPNLDFEELTVPRLASSIILSVAILGLAACHPREHHDQTQQESGQNQGAARHPGGLHIRKACADEIAKYCQNADRKKRCLRENVDKLGTQCKTALEAAKGHKRDRVNENKTDDNGD